jgi:uncharacterized protein YlxP (DUF503 family)
MSDDALVGLCTVTFYLPGVTSLKGKRRIVKSLIARMRNTYNVSCAEIAKLDKWQSAVIAFSCVSNSEAHLDNTLNTILRWIESTFPDALITDHVIEIF